MIVNVGLETSSGRSAESPGQAAHECRLPGAKLPVEQDDRARRQRPREALACRDCFFFRRGCQGIRGHDSRLTFCGAR